MLIYAWTDSLDEGQIEMVGNLVLFHLKPVIKLCSLPHPSPSAPPDSVGFAFFGSNEIENEIKKFVLWRKGEGGVDRWGRGVCCGLSDTKRDYCLRITFNIILLSNVRMSWRIYGYKSLGLDSLNCPFCSFVGEPKSGRHRNPHNHPAMCVELLLLLDHWFDSLQRSSSPLWRFPCLGN